MTFQERRRAERFRVNVDAQWESRSIQRKGTISDISTSGCFVLTAPEIKAQEPVKLGIPLPNGKGVTLSGEAVYAVEEIGFAVRFTDLGEQEQQFLQRLIDTARARLAQ
jgi:hypothetical protein